MASSKYSEEKIKSGIQRKLILSKKNNKITKGEKLPTVG